VAGALAWSDGRDMTPRFMGPVNDPDAFVVVPDADSTGPIQLSCAPQPERHLIRGVHHQHVGKADFDSLVTCREHCRGHR